MRLTVSYFHAAGALPMLAARSWGLYERSGLEVELVPTTSSDQLMSGLVEGRYEIVHAAPDNLVAWSDATGTQLKAWMGGSMGPRYLMARPGVVDVDGLRGGVVGVDSATSGFASVTRALLDRAGLDIGVDYTVTEVGGTFECYRALLDSELDATMLSLPLARKAANAGYAMLVDHRQPFPRLQTAAAGSRADWLEGNADVAASYLRAILGALGRIYRPGTGADLLALTCEALDVDEQQADEIRSELFGPVQGWPPSAMLDTAGFVEVCRLRRRYVEELAAPAIDYLSFEPHARVLGTAITGNRIELG